MTNIPLNFHISTPRVENTEATNLLLIKGSRVRVPPGSPQLADNTQLSDSYGQLKPRSEPLIGSESSTQSPFFRLAGKAIAIGFLFASSLPAENRFWKWTAAALVAGTAADAASSYGRFEANPLLRGRDGRFGSRGIAIKIGAAGGTLLIERLIIRKNRRAARAFGFVNLAGAGTFGAVAVRNWRVGSGR